MVLYYINISKLLSLGILLHLLVSSHNLEAQSRTKDRLSLKKGKIITIDRLVFTDKNSGLEIYLRTVEKKLMGQMTFRFLAKCTCAITLGNIYIDNHTPAHLLHTNDTPTPHIGKRLRIQTTRELPIQYKSKKATHFVIEDISIWEIDTPRPSIWKHIKKMLFITTKKRTNLPHYLRRIDEDIISIDISEYLH